MTSTPQRHGAVAGLGARAHPDIDVARDIAACPDARTAVRTDLDVEQIDAELAAHPLQHAGTAGAAEFGHRLCELQSLHRAEAARGRSEQQAGNHLVLGQVRRRREGEFRLVGRAADRDDGGDVACRGLRGEIEFGMGPPTKAILPRLKSSLLPASVKAPRRSWKAPWVEGADRSPVTVRSPPSSASMPWPRTKTRDGALIVTLRSALNGGGDPLRPCRALRLASSASRARGCGRRIDMAGVVERAARAQGCGQARARRCCRRRCGLQRAGAAPAGRSGPARDWRRQ